MEDESSLHLSQIRLQEGQENFELICATKIIA